MILNQFVGNFRITLIFPTLDQAVCKLVREETRLSTLRSQHPQHTHPVLVAHFPNAHLLHSRALTGQVADLLPRIMTTIIVAIVAAVGILLTNVGARPNLLHLLQLLPLLRVFILQLLPLASLQDLVTPYLQLTLRQLSTKSSLVLVMHLPLSSPFCQVNLPLGFLILPAAIT
jgi:hypothetical protein